MKTKISIATVLIILFTMTIAQTKAQKRKDLKSENNMEASCAGTGQKGLKPIEAWGYGKKPAFCITDAEKAAIRFCLFMGCQGDNSMPPLIPMDKEYEIMEKHKAYFNSFFSTGGLYRSYIENYNSPNRILEKSKVKGGYKAKLYVLVRYDKLRQELEAQNIIEKVQESLAGATKPQIMIMPDKEYMKSKDYVSNGKNDYDKLISNDREWRKVTDIIKGILQERGYDEITNFAREYQEFKEELAHRQMATSKNGDMLRDKPEDLVKMRVMPDIVLELNFYKEKVGPKTKISGGLRAIDAYTNEEFATELLDGSASYENDISKLYKEAIFMKMDNFNAKVQKHFEAIAENGREIDIIVEVWQNATYLLNEQENPLDLETEFSFDGEQEELRTIIEYWIADNAKSDDFRLSPGSENKSVFESIKIPLFKKDRRGRTRNFNAKAFADGLRKYLTKEYGIIAKNDTEGMGKVRLIIGSK